MLRGRSPQRCRLTRVGPALLASVLSLALVLGTLGLRASYFLCSALGTTHTERCCDEAPRKASPTYPLVTQGPCCEEHGLTSLRVPVSVAAALPDAVVGAAGLIALLPAPLELPDAEQALRPFRWPIRAGPWNPTADAALSEVLLN